MTHENKTKSRLKNDYSLYDHIERKMKKFNAKTDYKTRLEFLIEVLEELQRSDDYLRFRYPITVCEEPATASPQHVVKYLTLKISGDYHGVSVRWECVEKNDKTCNWRDDEEYTAHGLMFPNLERSGWTFKQIYTNLIACLDRRVELREEEMALWTRYIFPKSLGGRP